MSSPRATSAAAPVVAAVALLAPAGLASASDAELLSFEGTGGTATRIMDEQVIADDAVLLAAMQDDDAGPEEGAVWSGSFAAGFAGSFGNTDKQSAFARGEASRDWEGDQRSTLTAAYYYGASDGDRDDNKFEGIALHEWLLPESKWSIFLQGNFDYDEFQSWEYRASAFAGFGYELMREEDFELDGRIGAGVTKEFNSPNDDLRAEALLGLDARWQISDKQELTASTTWYPSLSDGGEYRTVNRADWTVLLDEEMNLSLAAGIRHEYQSERAPGVEPNDIKVTVGLQFDF